MADGFDALEAVRPRGRRHRPPRGRAPEHDDPADRVRELHVAGGARGAGLGAHQQVLRGLPGQALLRRQPASSTRPRSWPATRACELFGAEHANVQPHSGANANMAAYLALLEPGDKVMGMRLDQGGHLTHGSPVNFSGRHLRLRRLRRRRRRPRRSTTTRSATSPRRERPKTDHRRRDRVPARHRLRGVPLDRRRGRRAAASSTPRTSPGSSPAARTRRRCRTPTSSRSRPTRRCAARAPGAILCREQYAAGDRQGGVPRAAGRAADARRSRRRRSRSTRPRSPTFREYAAADRAQRAARSPAALADEGFRIVSGGTDNHLMLVDLRPFGVTGKVAQEALDRAGITCNKNAIPNDPEKPFVTSGLRLGTAAVTTAGMGEAEMAEIAGLIAVGAPRARRRRPSPATCATPRTGSAPSSRRTQSSNPAGRERRSRGGLRGRLRGRAADARSPSRRSCGGSRSASARSSRRTRAACTPRRCRRSAARRCSSASSSRWRSRRRSTQFHEMFDGTRSRSGSCSRAGVMFVGRRARRPPRRVAAGEDRRAGAGREPPLALRRLDVLLPGPVRRPGHRRALGRPRPARHRARRSWCSPNAINLIDGLDGLAAGIVVIAGAALFLYADRLFKAGLPRGREHRAARRGHRGRRSASGSCRTTSTRRGSSWATPARCSSGCCSRRPTITIGGRTD